MAAYRTPLRFRSSNTTPTWSNILLPQNLVHRFSLRELIDELVQVANVFHQRIFDFLQTNAAHQAFDERAVRMNRRCVREKSLEIAFLLDLLPQLRGVIPG